MKKKLLIIILLLSLCSSVFAKKKLSFLSLDLGFGDVTDNYTGLIYGFGYNNIDGYGIGPLKFGYGYRLDVFTNYYMSYTDSAGVNINSGNTFSADYTFGIATIIDFYKAFSLGILVGPDANIELNSQRLFSVGLGGDIILSVNNFSGLKLGIGVSVHSPWLNIFDRVELEHAIKNRHIAIIPHIGFSIF